MAATWIRTKKRRGSVEQSSEHVEQKPSRGSDDSLIIPPYNSTVASGPTGRDESRVPELQQIDIEDIKTSWLIFIYTAIASMGENLFGYDTGIIGHILPHLNEALCGVSTAGKAAIISMASVGAFFGGQLILLSERYGRKHVMHISAGLYIIGAVIQVTANSVAHMICARLILGLSIGAASAVAPMYIGEIAPAKSRGKMTGMFNLAITGTQLVGYGIGISLGEYKHGLEIMTGIGGVIALGWLTLLQFCPESPRYLIGVDREKATAAVKKLRPNVTQAQIEEHVGQLLEHMEEAKAARGERNMWSQFKQLFTKAHRMKTFAACGLMALSQLSGFNSLMYFAPTLLVLLGFAPIVAIAIPGTNLLVTAIYMSLVDRVGRRRLLLWTSPLMFISLIVSVVAWEFNDSFKTAGADDLVDKILAGDAPKPALHNYSFIVLGTMIGLVVGYAGAIGNVAWTSSELFPTELRSHGTMFMTMWNWGSNIFVSATFLPLFENLGSSATSGIYSGLCFVAVVFAYCFFPEVKGLTLEDIGQVFVADESPVKAANKKQRELKAERNQTDLEARAANVV